MGTQEVENIKKIFSRLAIEPTYLHHKEIVVSSEEAARTRGFELRQGIKAILMTNEQAWIIVNVPADKKVDTKKVAEQLGWSKGKIRMATAEEVLEKTGCELGAVPPLGHKEMIPIIVDEEIYENSISTFNIGTREESVSLPTTLMKKIFEQAHAIEGNFVRER